VLIPPNVRHSLKATEDGPCAYLYVKDQTWTVVGLAADEQIPDKPMTVEEVNTKFEAGELEDRKGGNSGVSEVSSQIIIDGVPNCYYQIVTHLDEPFRAGLRIDWIEGEREAFGFFEIPRGYAISSDASDHEQYIYLLEGRVDATVGNEQKIAGPKDIIEIPKDMPYSLSIDESTPTRFVVIRSTKFLEDRIPA
jgi:quercetin dioxygenase-like cupin family protein